MSFYKMKRRPTDVRFSNLVRERANWRCQYCGRLCKINGVSVAQLDASHYHGRRKESVRFDLENVRALCGSCHKRMGDYKNSEDGEYDLWVKELLGDRAYKLLKIRANTPGKRDDFLTNLYIKELEKERQ